MSEENQAPGVTEQLCAFMELNGIDYLETRATKASYLINTIISKDEEVEEEEDEE